MTVNEAEKRGLASALKPCPFCGELPEISHVPSRFQPSGEFWWVGCQIRQRGGGLTGCGIGHSALLRLDAINKWNTRAPQENA